MTTCMRRNYLQMSFSPSFLRPLIDFVDTEHPSEESGGVVGPIEDNEHPERTIIIFLRTYFK